MLDMAKKQITAYRIKNHAPGMIHVNTVGDIDTQRITPSQLAKLRSLGVPLEEVKIDAK